jgi:hypothetical protein
MTIVRYGLRDLWIADWVAENSYGTAVRLLAAQSFTVTFVVETATLPGDDIDFDTFAKIRSVDAQLRNGELTLDGYEILTGGTLYEGTGYTDLMIGDDETENAPYFAICGRVIGTNSGDTHLFIPKAKIAGNLSYQAQQSTYLVPEVAIKGIREGSINGMARIRHHDAVTAVAIPFA